MKKPRITNEIIVNNLTSAGLVPFSRFSVTGDDRVSPHRNVQLVSRLAAVQQGYNYYYESIDLFIPLDLYNEHSGTTFRPPIDLGTRVKISRYSSRNRQRSSYTQHVGDTYNWKHLGIGSGRQYKYAGIETEQIRLNNYLDINYLASKSKIKELFQKGHYYIPDWKLSHANNGNNLFIKDHVRTYDPSKLSYHFKKTACLIGDGIFGLKSNISGYVTDVYIYIKYPSWKSKRESRYEITFETGAKGVFTSDYMEKSFDTDYELDESLCVCECASKCDNPLCDHKKPHEHNYECDEICNRYGQKKSCTQIYNIYEFPELTITKGVYDRE